MLSNRSSKELNIFHTAVLRTPPITVNSWKVLKLWFSYVVPDGEYAFIFLLQDAHWAPGPLGVWWKQ